MDEVLLLVVMSAANILCFVIGAKVGQTVCKGEEVELPTINPVKAVREHQEKKEAEYQWSRVETILSNVEVYNGTEQGQEDVPRR